MTTSPALDIVNQAGQPQGFAAPVEPTPPPPPAPDHSHVVGDAVLALGGLVDSVAGVQGALIATVDGRPFAAQLPSHDDDATAAIVAASLGLGHRLADLCGEGEVQEIVVRSASGYTVIYRVGDRGVLTVLTTRSANLALLHLAARDVAAQLAGPLTAAIQR